MSNTPLKSSQLDIWCKRCGKSSCVINNPPHGCWSDFDPPGDHNSMIPEYNPMAATLVIDGAQYETASIISRTPSIDWSFPKEFHVKDEQTMLQIVTGYLGDAVFAKQFVDCMSMMRVKNADYSQGEQKGDRIAAFRRIAHDINIPMTKAWAVFCQKHWGAIMRFIKEGSVESEPIEGRITDVINYMVLLAAIIADENNENE